MAKPRAREVLINYFHFRLLAFGSLADGGDFDQSLAQRHRHGQRDFRISDPHAVNEAKGLDFFRQSLADNDGDLSFGGALVLAQFRQPTIGPIFRALAFPKNRAADLIERSDNALEHVSAELAFGYG